MTKINTNQIVFIISYALATLTILVVALVASPAVTSAQYQNQYQYQNQNTGSSGYWGGYKYVYPTPSVVYATPYTTPYVAPVYSTPTTYYPPVTTVNNTTTTTNTTTDVSKESTESYTKLTANAVFGYNSIFPSGLIQWVCFAILILLITILVRKMSGAEARYHATPLKYT